MSKRKDLSDFDMAQIVTARQLGQSISKVSGLVACSCMQLLVPTKRGVWKDNRCTCDREPRAKADMHFIWWYSLSALDSELWASGMIAGH